MYTASLALYQAVLRTICFIGMANWARFGCVAGLYIYVMARCMYIRAYIYIQQEFNTYIYNAYGCMHGSLATVPLMPKGTLVTTNPTFIRELTLLSAPLTTPKATSPKSGRLRETKGLRISKTL